MGRDIKEFLELTRLAVASFVRSSAAQVTSSKPSFFGARSLTQGIPGGFLKAFRLRLWDGAPTRVSAMGSLKHPRAGGERHGDPFAGRRCRHPRVLASARLNQYLSRAAREHILLEDVRQ